MLLTAAVGADCSMLLEFIVKQVAPHSLDGVPPWSGYLMLVLELPVAVVALTKLYVAYIVWRTGGMPSPGFTWVLRNFHNYHAAVAKLHNDVGGGLYNLFLGPKNCVVVADPELVKEVLNDMTRFEKMGTTEIWTSKQLVACLRDNIINLNGDDWWRVKRTFAGAFHMSNVRTLIPVFHERTMRVFRLLRQRATRDADAAGGLEIQSNEWLARITMDYLTHTLFSYDVGALPDDINAACDPSGLGCPCCKNGTIRATMLVDSLSCLFAGSGDIKGTCVPFYDNLPFEHYKCLPRAIDALRGLFLDMIKSHQADLDLADVRSDLRSREAGASRDSFDNTKYKSNLLHMMLDANRKAENPMTDEELRVHLIVFFMAGHETTATALTWATHYLAMHPDKQQRLRDELVEKLGPLSADDDEEAAMPTQEQLGPKELPYLNAVMKEVIRLRPSIANIQSRVATCDTTLGNYKVRKGMFVAPNVYAVHHDRKLWPDPEEFRPERFLVKERRHPCAYIPFSFGPRQCVGNNFSIIEQRVFLAHFIRAWRLEVPRSGKTHDNIAPHFFGIAPNRSTSDDARCGVGSHRTNASVDVILQCLSGLFPSGATRERQC